MVSVGAGAIADDFRERRGAARQRVFQCFNHQHAGTFPHDKSVPGAVERPRGLSRQFGRCGRHGACSGEAAQADSIYRGFGTAAQRDIGLIIAEQSHCVADGLHAGRTGGDRCANRAFEVMLDGNVAGRQIDQKEGMVNGDRRLAPRLSVVRTARQLLKPPMPEAMTVAVRSCFSSVSAIQPAREWLHPPPPWRKG